MSFNKKYEEVMMGILFGIAWLFLLYSLNIFMKLTTSQFGWLLMLCGATGFYQAFVNEYFNKKNKKKKNGRGKKKNN